MLTIKDVKVEGGNLSDHEIQSYIDHIHNHNSGMTLDSLIIRVDGEYAEMEYTFEPVQFERIRRITGYLVGTTDRFNNAKRAEEHDRVKHMNMNTCGEPLEALD